MEVVGVPAHIADVFLLSLSSTCCWNLVIEGVINIHEDRAYPQTITSADLSLWNQFWTASRLNVSSNLRRILAIVFFMGLLVHCSPNSLQVNSKQPHEAMDKAVRVI
jgi:hypothetical protein